MIYKRYVIVQVCWNNNDTANTNVAMLRISDEVNMEGRDDCSVDHKTGSHHVMG